MFGLQFIKELKNKEGCKKCNDRYVYNKEVTDRPEYYTMCDYCQITYHDSDDDGCRACECFAVRICKQCNVKGLCIKDIVRCQTCNDIICDGCNEYESKICYCCKN